MMMPDYGLMHMVQILSDGADAHRTAQELNTYSLAIHALNESRSDDDRALLDGVRQRAETNLRGFVTRKRLAAFH